MRIAVLDDEKTYSDQVRSIIHSYYPFDIIDTFNNADDLINKDLVYDLLVLDIEMPEMDGITFVKNYASLFPDILFITSHDSYVFDAFLPNVRGYIIKDQMNEAFIPKLQQIKEQKENMIAFNADLGILPVLTEHIQYFYTEDTFVYLITLTSKYSLTYKSLKQLPINYDDYIYVSRSCLVRTKSILKIKKTTKSIEMMNKDSIQVSRRNWKALIEAYTRGG